MNKKGYAAGIYRSAALKAFAQRGTITRAQRAELAKLERDLSAYEAKSAARAENVLNKMLGG